MSKEERLFDAIGGVDESLLKRSEKRKKRTPWLSWGIGLAACLAVVLTVVRVLPGTFKEPSPPDSITDDYPPDCPPALEDPEGPGTSCTKPNEPWPVEEGEVHYLAVRTALEEPELRFRVYINKEIYYSYEQEGVYIIRPRQEPEVPDETLPECKLEITHMTNVTVDEALEQVKASLTGLYETVEAVPGPPNGWFEVIDTERYLFARNGIDWDSAQREVWIKPDGAGGAFVLTSSYFMEATEGHGARFVDMMSTFVTAYNDPNYPDLWLWWETDLLDAGERLAEAVFADDLSNVSGLLTENAEVYGYGEDVSGDVSVASIDCSSVRDNMLEGGAVTVSVKHRMDGEDSYSFLTMEMTYLDSQWKAYWIGLEK